MRMLLTALVAGVLFSTLGGSAAAARTIVTFNPARGEFPEGIAFARDGALYVSLAPRGEIWRFDGGGGPSTLFAVDPGTTGLAILGLAIDRAGVVYAAVPSSAPSAHGVWAISPDGDARRLPGSSQIVFPNGIALDHQGILYVTDSISGAIWRIPPEGQAEIWLQDPLLAGTATINPFPLGANGIAYAHSRLLVANTEKKHVVEIPIDHGGEHGTPRVLHAFAGDLDFLDGIAVDVAGDVYVIVSGRHELVRLERSGEVITVADAEDGLSVPASLAFGTRSTGLPTLSVTNLSLPGLVPVPMPSVIAVDVPLPGPPLP